MVNNFINSNNNNELDFCFSAMSGEFPGAPSIDSLWDLLKEGKTAKIHSLLPNWNINLESIFDDKPGCCNKVYLDKAFTLNEPVGSLSRQLEIGERVLHQLFKEPKLDSVSLPKEKVGLILATSWSDESYFASEHGLSAGEQVQVLADQLQLGGPALTIDTACSSFHYALEMGRNLIISGQADQVVVMAINTVLALPLYLGFSQLTAFSADAFLRAFGSEPNGIVPAECACAFLLEPLNSALESGRAPYGILKAIGLSSDGNEGSVFSPGENAQIAAYQRAWLGYDPESIDYLEAHGTGTPLGDKTELNSINKFFVDGKKTNKPLILGSIKANLGHALAAAGGPSLAKALLMLKNQYIPPQPDYKINSNFQDSDIKLATSDISGPRRLDRIGISSFGFGGSNAHMIIDKPHRQKTQELVENNGCLKLNLAVIDAEVALGGAFSLSEWNKVLNFPKPLQSFPVERFSRKVNKDLKKGYYLNQNHTIDAHGYSMGPKALDHIDPYKLLLTSLTSSIINRYPSIANDQRTGVMICCNTGGESFSNAYTRCDYFRSKIGTPPNIIVADVASMLPSMLSGYVAKIFNLRGFHQTLAGKAGLLWHTLLTLPSWLNNGFDQILLGAGRYISSYSELRHCDSNMQTVHGEGAGILLIKPWMKEDSNGLILLHCAVFATHASTLSDACCVAGIDINNITQVNICELDPLYQDATKCLYKSNGWLSEACGIEHLLQQIVSLTGYGVIEVCHSSKPVMWIFTERLGDYPKSQTSINKKLPYILKFSQSKLIEHVNKKTDVSDNAERLDVSLNSIHKQVSMTVLQGIKTRSLIMEKLMDVEQKNISKEASYELIKNCKCLHDCWSATLIVDEAHPYFFDHPLDHVPGILLIAGALQLIEYSKIFDKFNFINTLNVRFNNYVDKNSEIKLKLKKCNHLEWAVYIEQYDKIVCTIKFTYKFINENILSCKKDTNDVFKVESCQDIELLHKHRTQNVLVSNLFLDDNEYYVFTTQIAHDHFFLKTETNRYLSMVYFLEIARQCYMQIAHKILQIPLGIPMNLVILDFALKVPIPRDCTLRISTNKQQVPKSNNLNNISYLSLSDGERIIGEVKIIAQVLGS